MVIRSDDWLLIDYWSAAHLYSLLFRATVHHRTFILSSAASSTSDLHMRVWPLITDHCSDLQLQMLHQLNRLPLATVENEKTFTSVHQQMFCFILRFYWTNITRLLENRFKDKKKLVSWFLFEQKMIYEFSKIIIFFKK